MDLSGWKITSGVNYTFPAGTSIAAGAYLVLTASPAIFHVKYPAVANYIASSGWQTVVAGLVQPNGGILSNSAEPGNCLTDSLTLKTKFLLPPLTFLGGTSTTRWLQLIADNDSSGTPNHVNYTLNPAGHALGIFSASGVQLESVPFGVQAAGISGGRLADGTVTILALNPTPGHRQPSPLHRHRCRRHSRLVGEALRHEFNNATDATLPAREYPGNASNKSCHLAAASQRKHPPFGRGVTRSERGVAGRPRVPISSQSYSVLGSH